MRYHSTPLILQPPHHFREMEPEAPRDSWHNQFGGRLELKRSHPASGTQALNLHDYFVL